MAELHNVYSGVSYKPIPAVQEVDTGNQAAQHAIQLQAKGAQAFHENLSAFEMEAVERAEYTLDMQRKRYIAEKQGEIEARFARGMHAADGSADSFYDANGVFLEDKYASFMRDAQSQFSNLAQGYILPQSQQKAQADINMLQTRLKASCDLQLAKNMAPRAKAATDKLINYLVDQGDFIGANATLDGAPSYAYSPMDRKVIKANLSRKQVFHNATVAVQNGDFDTYLNILNDPATRQNLTPDDYDRLMSGQRAFTLETPFPDDEYAIPMSEGEGGGTSSSKRAKSGAANLKAGIPLGVPDEIVKLYDQWRLYEDGAAKDNPDFKKQAYDALDAWGSAFVTANMQDADVAFFNNVAETLGMNQSEGNAIIKKYQKAFATSKSFNPNSTLTYAEKNYFVPPQVRARLTHLRKEIALEAAKATPDPQKQNVLEGQLRHMSNSAKAFKEECTYRIKKRYADWRNSLAEPPSDYECNAAMLNAIDQELEATYADFNYNFTPDSDYDFSSSNVYKEGIADSQGVADAARQAAARREELNERVLNTDANRLVADVEAENEATRQAGIQQAKSITPRQRSYGTVDLDLTISSKLPNTNTEAYLAVPKGDPLEGKTITFKHKGRTHQFTGVASDVSQPTFSQLALLSMQMAGNKGRYSIAYKPNGEAALYSSAVKPKEVNIYKAIINEEAHRDASGRVKVFVTPRGDGGKIEVAGINQTSHPEEYKKLKAMVDSNATNDEIESEIMAYMKKYTQPGADIIKPATTSKGIELFVRDCCFNHGNGGAKYVMRKAVGAPKNEDITSYMKSYVATYGEKALLDSLINARRSFFYEIAKKPGKAKFLNGWLNNRLRDISRAANACLRERSVD